MRPFTRCLGPPHTLTAMLPATVPIPPIDSTVPAESSDANESTNGNSSTLKNSSVKFTPATTARIPSSPRRSRSHRHPATTSPHNLPVLVPGSRGGRGKRTRARVPRATT